jgi:hypothetical protein
LRRKVLVTTASSAAVALTGAGALVLGWRFPAGVPLPFLIFAAVAFVVSYVGLVTTPRWYRYVSRVVASTEPTVAPIVLHLDSDADVTSLYASLATSSPTFTGALERFPLLIPRWRVDVQMGTPIEAKVYRDPLSQQPVAFQITGGLLWCLPYRRAAPW